MTDAVIIKGRQRQKHDTEANWNKATNFAPYLGEIIVYDPDNTHSYPRYKTGIWDGVSQKTSDMLIMNLPFSNQPDVISEDDILGLFTAPAAVEYTSYTSFKMHLIDSEDKFKVVEIRYVVGKTTWEDLVITYPEYFEVDTSDWDKETGKPLVRFTEYHGKEYVTKKVTPEKPEDPASAPCSTSDIVDPAVLRDIYVCAGEGCAICELYQSKS
jgi:hypothetical protein